MITERLVLNMNIELCTSLVTMVTYITCCIYSVNRVFLVPTSFICCACGVKISIGRGSKLKFFVTTNSTNLRQPRPKADSKSKQTENYTWSSNSVKEHLYVSAHWQRHVWGRKLPIILCLGNGTFSIPPFREDFNKMSALCWVRHFIMCVNCRQSPE